MLNIVAGSSDVSEIGDEGRIRSNRHDAKL
jgi:hypothetical protein